MPGKPNPPLTQIFVLNSSHRLEPWPETQGGENKIGLGLNQNEVINREE